MSKFEKRLKVCNLSFHMYFEINNSLKQTNQNWAQQNVQLVFYFHSFRQRHSWTPSVLAKWVKIRREIRKNTQQFSYKTTILPIKKYTLTSSAASCPPLSHCLGSVRAKNASRKSQNLACTETMRLAFIIHAPQRVSRVFRQEASSKARERRAKSKKMKKKTIATTARLPPSPVFAQLHSHTEEERALVEVDFCVSSHRVNLYRVPRPASHRLARTGKRIVAVDEAKFCFLFFFFCTPASASETKKMQTICIQIDSSHSGPLAS